jgi:hypothetical protein
MQKSPARSAILASVYGGVVLLLLLLALFTRGFSQSIGDARVGGRYSTFPLFQSTSLETLTVSWNGLSLRFSRTSTPGLRYMETIAGGAEVVFDGDLRLRLQRGSDVGGSLSLSAVTGGAAGGELTVPFAVTGILADPPQGAALAWTRQGRTYLLTLPQGAGVDEAARTITLTAGGGTASLTPKGISATIAATPQRTTGSTTSAARQRPAPREKLPAESALPTAAALQAGLVAFSEKAYMGWAVKRLSTETGLWSMPDGSAGFSEDLGIFLLAESLERGTWQRFLPLWTDALARQQARGATLSYRTGTYTGTVREYFKAAQDGAAARIAAVSALIAKPDNAALEQPDLVPLIADHGTQEQLQACIAFLASRTVTALDAARAVGLLEALLAEAELTAAGASVDQLIADLISKKILPAVRTTDAGLFLDSGSGSCDVRQGIRCGALLLRAGPRVSSTLAAAVGRGLVLGALGLADDNGFLPSTVAVGSGKVSSRQGGIAPESFYALLPLDRLAAREVPLARQVGSGAWIWTAARIVRAEGSSSGLTIVLGFPAGTPHNFIIQGIPVFTQIKLHGIPWHSDTTYYRYSDGWAFDPATRTLYMKLTGRSDQEEIDIFY